MTRICIRNTDLKYRYVIMNKPSIFYGNGTSTVIHSVLCENVTIFCGSGSDFGKVSFSKICLKSCNFIVRSTGIVSFSESIHLIFDLLPFFFFDFNIPFNVRSGSKSETGTGVDYATGSANAKSCRSGFTTILRYILFILYIILFILFILYILFHIINVTHLA